MKILSHDKTRRTLCVLNKNAVLLGKGCETLTNISTSRGGCYESLSVLARLVYLLPMYDVSCSNYEHQTTGGTLEGYTIRVGK